MIKLKQNLLYKKIQNKKIAIKRMKIKIEIQNKFYIFD
jgi:hypothetical protein